MTIVPVVLAGGIGERFWPLSRSTMPKQFLPLCSERTMIDETLGRASAFCTAGIKPLIVTGSSFAPLIKKAVRHDVAFDVIAEPVGKNTAPAIAIAAAFLEQKYGPVVMAVLPADHAISPVGAFVKTIRAAAAIATRMECLVVFGIKPGRPDTGYGYIKKGKTVDARIGACVVERFVEKPDVATARKYIAAKTYAWNSGMFVWKTSAILGECQAHMPGLYDQVKDVTKKKFSKASINNFYHICTKESIDYGIMERSSRVIMIEAPFSWDDVGSWEAVGRMRKPNSSGTTVIGAHTFEADSTQSIIYNSSDCHLVAIGLQNIVVVQTPDATLVIDKSRLPEYKRYLERIKAENFPAQLF